MKIAIIVRKLTIKGGTQRQALYLAKILKERGHDVTLYTFALDRAACFSDLLENMPVVVAPVERSSPGLGALGSFFAELRAAAALAHRIPPDTQILNPQDQVSYKVAAYFKKRINPRVPSVWSMNDMPTRYWFYWRENECEPKALPWYKRIAYKLYDAYDTYRFICPQDVISVLGERDRGWVREAFRKDAVIIRPGVDVASFPYVPRKTIAKDRIRLLMTGIFFSHRRFEDGIEAVRSLRKKGCNVSLTIVGAYTEDNIYYRKMKQLVASNNLEPFVTFAGKITETELTKMYQTHDIFLFPNHMQSWGLAVFEALASGLPVVISRTAGASEVLRDGETMLVVPPKSPGAIAEAVETLVRDPALYERLSRQGRVFLDTELSWTSYADAMEACFTSVVQTP